MSYSGYYQILCKNGHYDSIDCYEFYMNDGLEEYECPICNEKCAWWNLVDTTNDCYEEDDTSIKLELNTPAKYEMCIHCGISRIVKEETYKIPEKGGHKIDE